MFDEKNILYIKIWNHPIEATIYKWMFGVPGIDTQLQRFWPHPPPKKKKRKLDRNVEVFNTHFPSNVFAKNLGKLLYRSQNYPKNKLLLSIEFWLFDRNPYFMNFMP